MSAARPLVAPPDPDSTDHFVYLQGEGLIELVSPSQYRALRQTLRAQAG
jgi:hypothetical protein